MLSEEACWPILPPEEFLGGQGSVGGPGRGDLAVCTGGVAHSLAQALRPGLPWSTWLRTFSAQTNLGALRQVSCLGGWGQGARPLGIVYLVGVIVGSKEPHKDLR